MQVKRGSYWNSLFEMSKPSPAPVPNTAGDIPVNSYNSHKISYEDVLKTIVWDVKSYLNYRNHLNDYDLSAVVEGT